MPPSPSRPDSRGGGVRTRSRSRSTHDRRRPMSRSRSPRPDRGVRDSHRHGDGRRWRDRDDDVGRDRETADSARDEERAAKRHRGDRDGEREKGRSGSPGGDEEGGGSSQRRRHRHHHHREGHSHRHRHRSEKKKSAAQTAELPFGARQLARSDLAAFRSLFAHYLDLQKSMDIRSLDETEVRGRWKSFMGKWNRGELAEGWYDPDVFHRAAEDYQDTGSRASPPPRDAERSHSPASNTLPQHSNPISDEDKDEDDNDDDDDDDYGPPPPPPPGHQHHPSRSSTTTTTTTTRAPGPSIPTQTDLSLRDEDAAAARDASLTAHRHARHAHRLEQKALLDEALPRADAGTRERRVEKRKELNEKLRGFREKSPTGGGGEANEGELMGGGDGVDEYKAMARVQEERKMERVSRREEMERARRAEVEERVRGYREREERVVEGLRELARQRFGGGG